MRDLRPDWLSVVAAPLPEKINFVAHLGYRVNLDDIFPAEPLSEGIDRYIFATAHLVQPLTFLRLRPGHEEPVLQKLEKAGLQFARRGLHTLSFEQKVDFETLLNLDKEAVVQDASSQAVGELIPPLPPGSSVWDCCAGSGGKSFLVADRLPSPLLTVTDIRESILHNLARRFERGGLKAVRVRQADLRDSQSIPLNAFDLVIADLPCTGSGTWGRTPEQLYFFRPSSITDFSALQRQISMNVLVALKKGGYFLYVTCSAFREENEANIEFLLKHTELRQLDSRVISGYTSGADTMFVCLMQKT